MFIHSVSNLSIKRVVSANRLLNSPVGITTCRNLRERWAVALKVKGKTIYTVEGKEVLCDALHPVILSKGSTYSWKCVMPGECIIIEFDAEGEEKDFSSFEIRDNHAIINTFSKIEKCLSLKKPHAAIEANYYLYEILLFILNSAKKEYAQSGKADVLKPALTYISENYFDGGITNEFLANLCGISTVYFRKTFENQLGISPIRYLHNFRTEKAKAMLCSDYDSIEQVALSVGYNSVYHFSKMFKVYTGKSPSEYAKASGN